VRREKERASVPPEKRKAPCRSKEPRDKRKNEPTFSQTAPKAGSPAKKRGRGQRQAPRSGTARRAPEPGVSAKGRARGGGGKGGGGGGGGEGGGEWGGGDGPATKNWIRVLAKRGHVNSIDKAQEGKNRREKKTVLSRIEETPQKQMKALPPQRTRIHRHTSKGLLAGKNGILQGDKPSGVVRRACYT